MIKIFYIFRFVGWNYRINRTNGRTEWYSDAEKNFIHAGYNESMTIFDVLAWSKPGCHLAGRFVPAGDLPGTTKSASAAGNLFSRQSGIFAGRCEALREACGNWAAFPGLSAMCQASSRYLIFYPEMLQFWDADEEFDAVLKFMWDYNTTDFMHFETMAFATMHLIDRLKEIVEGFE